MKYGERAGIPIKVILFTIIGSLVLSTSSAIARITPSPQPNERAGRVFGNLTLAACPSNDFELRLSKFEDRSDATPLCQMTVTGKIYVFLTPQAGPTRVEFYLDGKYHRTERTSPWDFAGGNQTSARPFDTARLPEGSHTITARAFLGGGTSVSASSTFLVARSLNPSPSPTPTPSPSPTPSPTPTSSPSPSPLPSPSPSPSPTPVPTPLTEWKGTAGPAGVTCPAGGVTVNPGSSIQSAIDTAGSGASLCVRPGVYRITSPLRPKGRQSLTFEPGATLNGSRIVSTWAREGSYWIATGQNQSLNDPSPAGSPCDRNPAACQFEDLFMDDRPLTRVLSKSELSSGEFYFDESADMIYIADDPTAHKMEATVADTAIFAGGVQGVTIRGVTIEKFAHHGITTSQGWVIEKSEIRYVHSHGMKVYGDTKVRNTYIHHAGNMGIVGDGSGLLFEENHLAYNNYLNFGRLNGFWHAGATKIITSTNTVVRNNWSHHNTGDGWWFDTDNLNSVVEGNVFEHNTRSGLFYEASFAGVIRGNIFRDNGQVSRDDGAGLWINTSKNVDVQGNLFQESKVAAVSMTWTDRGTSSLYGERRMENLLVHDNDIRLTAGPAVDVPFGDDRIYSANNRFESNSYRTSLLDAKWWSWDDADRTWNQWRSYGHDSSGSLTP